MTDLIYHKLLLQNTVDLHCDSILTGIQVMRHSALDVDFA